MRLYRSILHVGASAEMQSAGSMTLTAPFSEEVLGYFGNFDTSTATLVILGNAGIHSNGVDDNHYHYSCNFASFDGALDTPSSIVLDEMMTCVGSTATLNTYNVTSGSVLQKIILQWDWSNDISPKYSALGDNNRGFWGLPL
jgi:hypothetical protein